MRHAHQPLRVAEAHSETAYTTNHAIEFFLEPWPYTMVSSFVLHQTSLALHCLIPIKSIISGS